MANFTSPLPEPAVEGATTHLQDHNALTAAIAELQGAAIDTADAETIALANTLLNEEQPITRAELVDGVLVLTRRDGVELTVEGSTSLAPSSVVWRLPWQSFAGSTDGGWLTRTGNRVTVRASAPNVRNGSTFFNPPVGFEPVSSRGQDSLIEAHGVTQDQVVVGEAAHFYGDTLYVDVPEALRNMTGTPNPETGNPTEVGVEWKSITVSWLTADADPAPAQTTDASSSSPLQVLPVTTGGV